MNAPRFIVVSGLPASGKSTLARALAAALDLPLLDKDVFLEALFDSEGIGDTARRRALSQAADDALRQAAEAPRGPVIEVHCRCSAASAAQRFMARQRHAAHLDGRWQHDELVASFKAQEAHGALHVGPLVAVDTEAAVSADALARCVAAVRAAIISAHSRA